MYNQVILHNLHINQLAYLKQRHISHFLKLVQPNLKALLQRQRYLIEVHLASSIHWLHIQRTLLVLL